MIDTTAGVTFSTIAAMDVDSNSNDFCERWNDNGKRDLFYLSSPRWKENKLKLKIPGPAYYFN